jgi:tetratricopeptide (TPR) repeat protein
MTDSTQTAVVFQQAQGLLQQGRYDEAKALLVPLTSGAQPSAQAHDLLAMLAVTRNQPEEALQQAVAANRLAPEQASVWFTLGRAHKLAGQLEPAIAAYRQALARQPQFAPAWVSLGIALRQNGELDTAIECYEKAIALAPQLGVAHGNLANALVQRAQRDAAADPAAAVTDAVLAASQKAVDLAPDDAQVLYNHGLLLYRAGFLPPAAEFYNRSLALNTTDLQCCLDLGQVLVELNRTREAISAYEKWLQLNTPHESVLMELGEQLVAVGRIEQAIGVAQQLVQLSPEGGGLVLLGNALLQARRHGEARAVSDAA